MMLSLSQAFVLVFLAIAVAMAAFLAVIFIRAKRRGQKNQEAAKASRLDKVTLIFGLAAVVCLAVFFYFEYLMRTYTGPIEKGTYTDELCFTFLAFCAFLLMFIFALAWRRIIRKK